MITPSLFNKAKTGLRLSAGLMVLLTAYLIISPLSGGFLPVIFSLNNLGPGIMFVLLAYVILILIFVFCGVTYLMGPGTWAEPQRAADGTLVRVNLSGTYQQKTSHLGPVFLSTPLPSFKAQAVAFSIFWTIIFITTEVRQGHFAMLDFGVTVGLALIIGACMSIQWLVSVNEISFSPGSMSVMRGNRAKQQPFASPLTVVVSRGLGSTRRQASYSVQFIDANQTSQKISIYTDQNVPLATLQNWLDQYFVQT